MAREPGYCLHKPTGQAYVRLGGRVHYLGLHGSEESKDRYNRLKAEWLVNRHAGKFQQRNSTGPTVAQVCLAYLEFSESYYRDDNAKSGEHYQYKLTIRPLSELYATLPAVDFGVVQYRAVREWWLSDSDRSRQYVNKQMKRLVRVVKWAVGNGLMPTENYTAIKCVDPLKNGRCVAPESEPIKSVAAKLVEATLPHLTTIQADMVRLQQLVGCRPGELVRITPGMVDRSGDVWTITLAQHKTAYRGKSRVLYVGPQAQKVIAPYLLRDSDDYCFSPIESEKQRRAAVHEARVTPLSCGNRPGSKKLARKPRRTPGPCFTTGSYCRAITSACTRAKLEHWHPNQIRHSAATKIRREFGLEAAQVILGHSGADITQVYAEADAAKAIESCTKNRVISSTVARGVITPSQASRTVPMPDRFAWQRFFS